MAAASLIGTLPQWLTVLVLVVGAVAFAWAVRTGQAGNALSIVRDANEVLTDENKRLRSRVAELESTRSLEAIVKALEEHEERAAERDRHVVAVLGLIADRLGPEHAE